MKTVAKWFAYWFGFTKTATKPFKCGYCGGDTTTCKYGTFVATYAAAVT